MQCSGPGTVAEPGDSVNAIWHDRRGELDIERCLLSDVRQRMFGEHYRCKAPDMATATGAKTISGSQAASGGCSQPVRHSE